MATDMPTSGDTSKIEACRCRTCEQLNGPTSGAPTDPSAPVHYVLCRAAAIALPGARNHPQDQ